MPRSKNSNVSKSPFRDYRDIREHSQEPNAIQPEDLRSREEKVSDLTDLFIGDYHIDTDIIHAVLEECNWNVEAATEKLFEVFFTNDKPVERKRKEANGLASIAVSLLVDKSSYDKNSDSEIKYSLPKSTADYNLASIAGDVNNNSSTINQKQTSNLRPKVSSKDNLVHFAADSSKKLESKPATESKTLFECKSSQHDFYKKNSFGDMAVNMEYYEDARFDITATKTSTFNAMKDHLVNESNSDQKSTAAMSKIKPKFDVSKVSLDSAPSMNKVESTGFDDKKSASVLYTDKSMDSLFIGAHSPSTSTEWNMFYEQLNLQPVHTEKIYPQINVNELFLSPKQSDTPTSSSSFVNGINATTQSEASNQSGRHHSNFSKTDFKPDTPKLQSSTSNSNDIFEKPPSSGNGVAEKNLVIEKESNISETIEKHTLAKNILSPEACEFVPRVLDVKRPMTRKSPVKQLKPPTKTASLSDNRVSSLDKAHMSKKNKDNAHKKQPTISRNTESAFTGSAPHAQFIDPMDPLGWKEIRSTTSDKAYKSDFKINTKILAHRYRNDGFAESRTKTGLSKFDDHSANDKTALIPPFQFNSTTPSNKNKKTNGKRKERPPPKFIDSDNKTPLMPLETHDMKIRTSKDEFSGKGPVIHDFSQTIGDLTDHSLSTSSFHAEPSLSLPPSLRGKPGVDQSPTPLPQRDISKRSDANRVVPKGDASTTETSVANKVKFVGVKTPVGKLKHYIDKKQPVMFILRGLPGSGKSYLATQLVSECQRFNLQVVSLSSDSYFTSAGQYNFNAEQLSEAHSWNKQRAQQSLKNKQPVIIIDNTNTTKWEMLPYVEMAIINNYDVQVCEPDTQWKNKVAELSRRNQHGVTKDHIKRMKDRYEHVTTEDILRAATKSLKGKNKLPTTCKTAVDQHKESTQRTHTPASKLKPHAQAPQFNCNLGNVSTANSDSSVAPVTAHEDAPEPTVPGLTQWLPSMEKRDYVKKSKRPGRVEKEPKPQEITLDFLNNSIKKALVGIEKTQGESEKQGPQPEHMDKVDSRRLVESLDSKSLSGQEDENEASSDCKIGSCVDDVEEIKSKEPREKEENQPSELVTEPGPVAVNSLIVSNLMLPGSRQIDNLDSTGELFYSCDSEESDDLKKEDVEETEQDLFTTDENEKKKSMMLIPKTCETSVMLNSTSEKLTTTDGENVREKHNLHIVIPVSSKEKDFDLLENSHPLLNFVNVEEKLEDNTANISHSGEMKEGGKDAIAVSPSLPQRQSLVLYSDSEDEDNGEGLNEGKYKECNRIMDMNAKPPFTTGCVENNKSSSCDLIDEQLKVILNKSIVEDSQEENESDQLNRTETESILISACATDENKDIQNFAVALDLPELNVKDGCSSEMTEYDSETSTSNSKECTPEPEVGAEEQSTTTYECVEYSCIRKKKNKKIKPVENTLGPFLEDALKEKSRKENWNKFFFIDNQNSEVPSSPSRTQHYAEMANVGSQCEPYYFSMVYRLNSQAFSNQQPIDISNLDVTVVQASKGLSWEDRFCSDAIVQRKSETTDRSTITDEAVDFDELDLDTLQNCFPERSRKYLEELMAVCHNNMEWVINNLMDAPSVLDFTEEDKEGLEEMDETEVKNEIRQKDHRTSQVKSLAWLCSQVVLNNQVLDSDDLEQEVINAGQTRLQEIEQFAWVRLHSSSVDQSQATMEQGAGSWPDDFNLGAFSGTYGLDDFEDDSASAPPKIRRLPHDVATSDKYKEQSYHTPDRSALYATPSPPVIPLEFIKCLEMNYGSFNVDLDQSGLVLDDSTARKIYNCLKLQVSKRHVQVGTDHEKQMREDEAIARALQEAENAVRPEPSNCNPAVQGWTNQMPSWMSRNTSQQSSISMGDKKNSSRANPARLNSVSETLHSLRGAWPKKMKPFKFHSKMQRQQDYSVWTSKAVSRPRVATMHSIMEEEKAMEANFKRMLVVNKATGNDNVLATKIKRSKLSAMFPFLPPDVLEEIFMNNGYSLELTVECLKSQYNHVPVHVSPEPKQDRDSLAIRYEESSSNSEQCQYLSEDFDSASYEDLRKEAQLFQELANECKQTANRHHRDGMHNVAFFYRQKGKTYLAEKDDANERAARVLFSKGSERLLRENTLDLHSYHIAEAIQAVNLALDIKKEEYKNATTRKRGYLTIITGRGRHSRWGIPRLKPAIITHLNNKNMRFEETTPGILKVHLFQE